MGLLRKGWDFLTFQDMPAAKVDRMAASDLDVRASLAMTPIPHQANKPQWPKRDVSTYIRDGYDQVVVAYRSINVIANAGSNAPLRAYERDDANQLQETKKHPLLRGLLQSPNPQMSQPEFVNLVVKIAQSTGFCVIEKDRSNAGFVIGLYPLRSDWLKPIPRDQRPYDWEYRQPGMPAKTISSDDVIHFVAESDPLLGPTGVPPLAAAMRELGIENELTNFTKGFLERGAVPFYGLIPENDPNGVEIDQTAADALKLLFRQASGLGRSVDPIIMKSIKDVKRLGLDLNEMAYPELRALTSLQICAAFGVPPILVGIKAGLDASTYSNYEQARKAFYEDTISPIWTRLEGALTRGLLPEFPTSGNVSLRFDASDVDALQEDENQLWTRAREALTASGITRNEYRREVGLAPVGNGDVFLVPFNITEVPAGKAPAQRSALPAMVTVRRADLPALPAGQTRAAGLVSLEQRSVLERRATRLYSKAGKDYGPKIYAFFQEQKERLLTEAKRSAPRFLQTRDVADLIALDWEQEANELDPLIRQLFDLMGVEATNNTNALLDSLLDWDLANPWVSDVLEEVAPRVQAITETTRNDIRKVIDDALAEGTNITDLTAKLEGLYDETYKGRSETIARTESMNAYNFASIRGYEESGVVAEVELLDNPLHDSDPGSDGLTCAQRNGLVVSLLQSRIHLEAEHPNGSIAVAPVLAVPLGED